MTTPQQNKIRYAKLKHGEIVAINPFGGRGSQYFMDDIGNQYDYRLVDELIAMDGKIVWKRE